MNNLMALADNALKLANDARLLFDNHRYETALSLSILSIEEAGKYFLLSDSKVGRDLNGVVRHHRKKQQHAALLVLTDRVIATVLAMKKVDHLEQLGPDFDLSDEEIGVVARLLAHTDAFADHTTAHSGQLDRLKQAGFYIDLGQERPTPDEFAAGAAKWLNWAEALAGYAAVLSLGFRLDPNQSS
jgi:AbiV family abortive infection protein